MPICQFVSATITPCLFLHCFLIFPAEKQFVQRNTWLLKLLYVPGIALCLSISFFYLRGQDYTREFFLIKLSPLENLTIGFLFVYSIAGQLLLLHTSFGAPSASQRRQARWLLFGIVAGDIPISYLHDSTAFLGGLDFIRSLFGLYPVSHPNLLYHRDHPAPVDEY